MGGDHCVMVIRNIISKQEGATALHVEQGKADISIDANKTSKENIIAAIEKMGYKVEQ